jgi:hypothetical protein
VSEPESARAGLPVRGEIVATVSALALLVLMFALKWFGVAGVPGRSAVQAATTTSENAWQALTTLRWLMLATIAVTLGSFLLHQTQRGHGSQTDTSLLVTVLGALSAASVAYRVLISLPAPTEVLDQKLGAVLGVFSAVGIAVGGFDSLREERARSRRLEQRSRGRSGVARGVRAR